MFKEVIIPDSAQPPAVIEGAWTRRSDWNWMGKVSTTAPIVAVTFAKVGPWVYWARSEKGPLVRLKVRLHLGRYDREGRDVNAAFSMEEGCARARTMLPVADFLPEVAAERTIAVGRFFSFCNPFGEPPVELSALLLFREHVVGGRNGLWQIKPHLRADLPPCLTGVLTHGRSGKFPAA